MKLIRFLISGGLAAVVNLSVLYILTDWFGWWYLTSATVSFFVSILVGFMLQKFWTFNHHQNHHPTHKQFLLYLIWMLLYLGLNIGLMYLLVDGFDLNYLVSQFITSGGLATLSFFVYSRVVFIIKPICPECVLEKTTNSYTI
jgi:putative flippase GtrA